MKFSIISTEKRQMIGHVLVKVEKQVFWFLLKILQKNNLLALWRNIWKKSKRLLGKLWTDMR